MPLPGGFLLDTNILLHMLRHDALGRYVDVTYGLSGSQYSFLVSVVTVGELNALAIKFGWGAKKRAEIEPLLAAFTIIDISFADDALLDAYGEIDGWSESKGITMGKNDVWIAATARVTNTTILTTDKDFDHLHPVDSSRSWLVDREWVDPNSKFP